MSETFLSEETARYYEDQWIAYQLKELSNGRYWFLNEPEFGVCRTRFWSIISVKEWSNISFHFELSWKRGMPMTEAATINIPIHLETKSGHEDKYQKAREYFEARGYYFTGNKEGAVHATDDSDLNATIKNPDFSSEEAAKKTIQEIIKVLDSDPYQKCAAIADAFLREYQ